LRPVDAADGFPGFFSESLQGDQIPQTLFWAAFEVLSQKSPIEIRFVGLEDGIGCVGTRLLHVAILAPT
jgi:hypothetical protein